MLSLWYVLVLQIVVVITGNKVLPSCHISERKCEFFLTLSASRMIGHSTRASGGGKFEEKVNLYGSTSVKHDFGINQPRNMSLEEASTIQRGDGSCKLAYLFNESLPGPALVIYHGQEVIVHVKNNLADEGTTVHWHGITQFKTPWMDGVEGLSQCIINPGQMFTYRFMPKKTGTFWYHTHSSTQRTMGAYGPLVILERPKENKRRGKDPLPPMTQEFYIMVTDWFKRSSREIQEIVSHKAMSFFNGWDVTDGQCFNSTKGPDGLDSGVVPFQSGLINGKGYHYNSPDEEPENPGLPLEEFLVEKGKRYRFRMISSAMAFAFRVSIDNHKLHVIATDGNDVVTRVVDYIIIASGERYDFWIEATDEENLGLYWIRAETYEHYNYHYEKITPSHTESILRYNTSSNVVPVSAPKQCTQGKSCEVLNCPFNFNGINRNMACLPVTELKSCSKRQKWNRNTSKYEQKETNQHFVEHFLNFHVSLEYTPGLDIKDLWTATINANRNKLFATPPQIQPERELDQRVPCDCPLHEVCSCNHVIEVPLGSVVQFVLLVTVSNPPGVLNGLPHNVHLHGYSFDVLKVAYPTYDPETGFYKDRNKDIECFGEYCAKAKWANKSWSGGNVPDTVQNPPVKDTILLPIGGYAVVQFTANNPGYWYMHCHTEFHNEEGMSLVLKVGNISEMTPAPHRLTQCGVPNWTAEGLNRQTRVAKLQAESSEMISEHSCVELRSFYRGVAIAFVVLTLVLFLVNLSIVCRMFRKRSYTRI